MIATLTNALAVLLGSILGLAAARHATPARRDAIYIALGVITLIIGIKAALGAQHLTYVAIALLLGGIIGTALNIEQRLLKLSAALNRLFTRAPRASDDEQITRFSHAFVNASLLFCIGPLAILGAFQAGVEGNYQLLFTKSLLDGCAAIFLTASMGAGVMLSIVPIIAYQGTLTLSAQILAPHVSTLLQSEFTAVGGALLIIISCNLLGIREIKTANFLPALPLITIVIFIAGRL